MVHRKALPLGPERMWELEFYMAMQHLPIVSVLIWSPMLWAPSIGEKGLLSELEPTREQQHWGWVGTGML